MKAFRIFNVITFCVGIITPFAIASWLVVFKTYPLLWGDYFHKTRLIVEGGLHDLLTLSWDHINIVPELMYMILNFLGLWSYQYHSFLSIATIGLGLLFLYKAATHEQTVGVKIIWIWIITSTVFNMLIAYRQMMNTLPLVFLYCTLLIWLYTIKLSNNKRFVWATILCLLGVTTNSHGIFLWIVAIVLEILFLWKRVKQIRTISVWTLAFAGSVLLYSSFAQYASKAQVALEQSFTSTRTIGSWLKMIAEPLLPFLQNANLLLVGLLLVGSLLAVLAIKTVQKNTLQQNEKIGIALMVFSGLGSLLVIYGRANSNFSLDWYLGAKYFGISSHFAIGYILFMQGYIKRSKLLQLVIVLIIIGHYSATNAYIQDWMTKQGQIQNAHACLRDLHTCRLKLTDGALSNTTFTGNQNRNYTLGLVEAIDTDSITFSEIKREEYLGAASYFKVQNDDVYIRGYASDGSCTPAKYIVLTTQYNTVIAHTTARYDINHYRNQPEKCTSIYGWTTLIQDKFERLIHEPFDVKVWILDRETNIAYLANR